MIEKKRLEELIEQGATIYDVFYGEVDLVDLTMIKVLGRSDNIVTFEYYNDCFLQNVIRNNKTLFETKEEAEWHKEFGCIERTERLELPTWEEIQKYKRFDFKDKYNHSYTLHYISGFKNLAISGWSTEYYAPATKENYTLACRKAKELFLGKQEVND